jgi:NADH:ubiquinone oxidoreductase subunit 6 (subunit J)
MVQDHVSEVTFWTFFILFWLSLGFILLLSFYSGAIYDLSLFIVYMVNIETPYTDWETAWPYYASMFFGFSLFTFIELAYLILIVFFTFDENSGSADIDTLTILFIL